MSQAESYRYSKDHEWASVESGKVRIGITDYAQKELGDVVYVDLPEVGKKLAKGDSICTVESVKAVSDVYAPVAGVITAVNEVLGKQSELVNQAPLGDGWFVVMEPADVNEVNELMTFAEYEKYVSEIAK